MASISRCSRRTRASFNRSIRVWVIGSSSATLRLSNAAVASNSAYSSCPRAKLGNLAAILRDKTLASLISPRTIASSVALISASSCVDDSGSVCGAAITLDAVSRVIASAIALLLRQTCLSARGLVKATFPGRFSIDCLQVSSTVGFFRTHLHDSHQRGQQRHPLE